MEELIGYNLKRAYVVVSSDFRDTLGEDSLSPRVFTALSLAIDTPGLSQSALARLMGIERSGLVAIVDELETRGFLTRAPVPGDRRVQALQPTKAGLAAYADAIRAVQDHEARLFSSMTEDEKTTLLRLLRKIRHLPGDG